MDDSACSNRSVVCLRMSSLQGEAGLRPDPAGSLNREMHSFSAGLIVGYFREKAKEDGEAPACFHKCPGAG